MYYRKLVTLKPRLKISYTNFENTREELYGNYMRTKTKQTTGTSISATRRTKRHQDLSTSTSCTNCITSRLSTIGPNLAFYKRSRKDLAHSPACFTLVSVSQPRKNVTCSLGHYHNPELVQAMEMRYSLMFPEKNGLTRVRSHENDRSYVRALVFYINSRAPKFTSYCFTNVSRSCNEAAHVLAKSAEYDAGSCWFNEIPDVIRPLYVCTEQANIYE
jgi:hypothetical protein